MATPRLIIDLKKIEHNAKVLVSRLGHLDISVTGIIKVMQGSPIIARALMRSGVISIGDSHIQNIELMCRNNIPIQMSLIRSPMLSQIQRIILSGSISFNSEIIVIEALSKMACKLNLNHQIILMIELGDLREGILPKDVLTFIDKVLTLPNISLKGIATNLMCLNDCAPDDTKMSQLSSIADSIEKTFNIKLDIISGGNSANLNWALNNKSNIGKINNLRLGEAIFIGMNPLDNSLIKGLYQDAISLVAEVIESKVKPSVSSNNKKYQSILAIGNQDIDSNGVKCLSGYKILGATSDHLIIDSMNKLIPIGTELNFIINYTSLLKAMMSSLVEKVFI
ncbi:amino-acid racemase [Francisella halioticida]|uniref:Alanine racemase n=1 Tax=Francisella halioticida TaxID=549298 RepID=A0ABM6M1T7_9GAMM|nr:alanine racemase [Francisella halioticida]ASG68936.1 alanine racemase [Francisella halioticida]BCD92221.1 amino-acid racemase [Francisella halioticida]